MVRVVFDTSAILSGALKQKGFEEVKKWLNKVAEGEATGLISAATVCEIFTKLTSVGEKDDAIILLDRLKKSGLVVMDVTEDMARLAGPLKAQFPQLSTADALIATTAYVHKATLFTFDKGFYGIGGVDVIGIN